eukprot:gene23290-3376_t
MGQSRDVLLLVLFVVLISLVLWSSFLFYLEGESISTYDRERNFWNRTDVNSLPPHPQHGAAKAVAGSAMIVGTFILAIPASQPGDGQPSDAFPPATVTVTAAAGSAACAEGWAGLSGARAWGAPAAPAA